jgi:hypothetical protein
MLAIVPDVLGEHGMGVRLVEDQNPIEELTSQGTHSSLADRILGAHGGLSGASTSSAAKTASKEGGYFASRSRSRKRNEAMRHPNVIAIFLACCVVHWAVGWAVTPARCRRRVPCSRKTRAYRQWNEMVPRCRRSAARMPWAWAFRNWRQVGVGALRGGVKAVRRP